MVFPIFLWSFVGLFIASYLGWRYFPMWGTKGYTVDSIFENLEIFIIIFTVGALGGSIYTFILEPVTTIPTTYSKTEFVAMANPDYSITVKAGNREPIIFENAKAYVKRDSITSIHIYEHYSRVGILTSSDATLYFNEK